MPSGGREVIESFQQLSDKVLSKTIWGVDFFMICDRDITDKAEVAAIEKSTGGKLKYLKRYHLENYFLDALTLSKIFEDIEPEESWLLDEVQIKNKLRQLAIETIPHATALIVAAQIRRLVGNISVMPKGLQQDVNLLVTLFQKKVSEEQIRTTTALDMPNIEQLIRQTYANFETICNDGSDRWIELIPGKQILSRFAPMTPLDVGRIKLAYVKSTQKHSLHTFDEIVSIFREFSDYQHD